jgi:hypothetical protein
MFPGVFLGFLQPFSYNFLLFIYSFVFILFVVLGLTPRAWQVMGRHCTDELYPEPTFAF